LGGEVGYFKKEERAVERSDRRKRFVDERRGRGGKKKDVRSIR